jgi:hypothetical protein
MALEKVGIIIPYRNRYEHLKEFTKHIIAYLNDKDINYKIIIVEQDDAKLFNRGMLLNIGYTYAKKLRCDYLVFHDIDMLPIEVDYSYSEYPIHLATDIIPDKDESQRELFEQYFGGVTMFPISDFEKINGYSNKYWGWGFEDDDLFFRCKINDIVAKTNPIRNVTKNTKILKFNGIDSHITSKNTIDLRRDFSITISFKPDDIKLNHINTSDEFTIFSIPGYDFAISYTSFNRYTFCTFNSELKPIYLNTEIKPNYRTNITLVHDYIKSTIKMYQDGQLVGETDVIGKFYKEYRNEEKLYIGVGSPNREIIPNWFKGSFEYFAHYDTKLSNEAILEIVNNTDNLLNKNFGEYTYSDNLKTYYESTFIRDYKLIDLSPNNNMGYIINCEIAEEDLVTETDMKIPHRRYSKFKSIKHDNNGFVNNRWKDDNTRWNQLRFVNEVCENPELTKTDGLSDLQFVVHRKEKLDRNMEMITVGI